MYMYTFHFSGLRGDATAKVGGAEPGGPGAGRDGPQPARGCHPGLRLLPHEGAQAALSAHLRQRRRC